MTPDSEKRFLFDHHMNTSTGGTTNITRKYTSSTFNAFSLATRKDGRPRV